MRTLIRVLFWASVACILASVWAGALPGRWYSWLGTGLVLGMVAIGLAAERAASPRTERPPLPRRDGGAW